jgi:hypothetical protein
MNDPDLKKQNDEIIGLGKQIAGLNNEELLAVTGASLVLGIMLGGLSWIFFSAALPVTIRRLYLEYKDRQKQQALDEIQREELIAQAKKRILELGLPEEENRKTLSKLDRLRGKGGWRNRQIGPGNDAGA